jgi:hypothetical protein
MTEMGEFLVGAWLKEKLDCDFIQYNARLPQANLEGQGEVDVIGLDLKRKAAYLCEVATHLRRLLYSGGYERTIEKLQAKFKRDKAYADKMLKDFPTRQYMFWSPVVPKGKLTVQLKELENEGVELVVNEAYAKRIEELTKMAGEKENNTGNPAFRLLQILEHVRKPKTPSPGSAELEDLVTPSPLESVNLEAHSIIAAIIEAIENYLKKLHNGIEFKPWAGPQPTISVKRDRNFAFLRPMNSEVSVIPRLPIEVGRSTIKNHLVKELSPRDQEYWFNAPCFDVRVERPVHLEEIFTVLEKAYEGRNRR